MSTTTAAAVLGARTVTESLQASTPEPSRRRRRRNLLSTLVVVGTLLVVFVLVRTALDDPPQKGPAGSSFATTSQGVAAYAELATRSGLEVVKLTVPVRDLDLDELFTRTGAYPDEVTLVVLDAVLDPDDVAALKTLLAGGITVIGDVNPYSDWITDLASVIQQPRDPASTAAQGWLDTGDVATLHVNGSAAIRTVGGVDSNSLLAWSGDAHLGVEVPVGDGSVQVFADWSMLSNDLLDEQDNAAFALGLTADRPVLAFAESPHGYEDASLTPTGLPWRVRWFLSGLLFTTLAAMWSRSRRNGPPESPDRPLAPPRSDYVVALAAQITPRLRRRDDRRRIRVAAPPQADPSLAEPPPPEPPPPDPQPQEPS